MEGFKVASPETLLILKQGAYQDRKASTKGRKDAIDILTLLIHAPIDWKKYRDLLEQNKLEPLNDELKALVQTYDPDDLKFIWQNPHAFKKWKTAFLEGWKKI